MNSHIENNMIEIKMSDWLYNAGLVGLVNALRFNKDEVEITNNSVKVDISVLNNFEEKYFNYLSNKYLVFTSWYRITDFQKTIDSIKEKDSYNQEDVDIINNHIEFLKTKLSSNSYVKAYGNIEDKTVDLLSESKDLKKISKKKKETFDDIKADIDNQLLSIERIIEFINKPCVKKHLIAKDLTYTVISNFWSDRSFLHRTKSDADIFKEFKDYFIDGIAEYNLEDKSKAKYSCFNCNGKINKLNDSHTLTWIQNIGADGNKKASHFWGLNRDDYICPICNLVYCCIPLGFIFLKGNGFFINNNSTVQTLLDSNNYALKSNSKILELEYKSYLKIADSFNNYTISRIENEIKNIQIIKLNTSNVFSPYTFNILSKDMVAFLNKNSKKLSLLLDKNILWYTDSSNNKHFIHLYKETIDRMYKNENLFSLINFALNKIVRREYHGFKEVEILLNINNDFLKGGDNMNSNINSKKIYKIRCLGNELKRSYEIRGASNKINGISYKLLNAIKVKDTNRFLDTLINAYAYLGIEIPTVFLDCLGNESTFQTVGYAFMLGLMGEQYNTTNKGDGTNE